MENGRAGDIQEKRKRKHPMKRCILPLALGITALFFGGTALAGREANNPTNDNLDDIVVLGEEDWAERSEILRNQYRRMTPGNGTLVQDAGTWPAAWETFGAGWDRAAAERDLATWVVPVSSEREGGATVLRDGSGAELWRGRTGFAKDDSANVALTGTLVDESDWLLYMAAKEELAWRRAAEACRQEPGGLRGTTHGPCTTGLHFVSAVGNFATSPPEMHVGLVWTNNATVDVFAYGPLHTSATYQVQYTNDENQVVTEDLEQWYYADAPLKGFGNDWQWVGSMAVSNTGTNVFVDSQFPTNRGIVRYYAAAEAVDSDGDGLNDGFETFVFHSDPELGDSDGDGIGDGLEVAMGANPADAEDSPKVTINAVFYTPANSNDVNKQWVELYSAATESMDLSGFRLEVGQPGGWSPALAFEAGTCIEPGRCLLAGGSQVTNADIATNTLAIPNPGRTDWPTGVRLVWGVATNGNVVDTVMLGGYTNFNLDIAGWMSPTSIWTYAGRTVVRRYPGLDTDRAEDWTWATNRPGQDSSIGIDTDGDGLPDGVEWTGSANTNATCYGEPTNPWNADSDGDGLSDSEECLLCGTNPNAWATDGDIYPWMPAGTVASNWPGSDSFEVASAFWDPTVADQNTNGIPDSWEMAFASWGLDIEGDADGDGVGNLAEIRQNSNPRDASDSTAKPFVIRFESSLPEWENNGMCDVGMKGWVRMFFEGVREDVPAAVWVTEGVLPEPFSITCAALPVWTLEFTDSQHAIATLRLESGTRPFLQVQDSGLWPNFVNTTGGEYLLDCIALETVEIEDTLPGGLIATNGTEITMHTGIYPDSYIPLAGEPKWMYQRRKRDGTWDNRTSFGDDAYGTTFTHTMDLSGIFRVKAVLHLTESMAIERLFTRKVDEYPHGLGEAGDPDAFGIADTPIQLAIVTAARSRLGSSDCAELATLPAAWGFAAFPADSDKCNIFVAHMAMEAGATVPAINGIIHDYPPTANQWAGTADTHSFEPGVQTDIDHWELETSPYPQPGFIVAHPTPDGPGHVGIVDYDGEGIAAGVATVNRNYTVFWDGTSGLRRYAP